jgi:hypothetical protein
MGSNRQQHTPIFIVKANGTTVEFTDIRQEAHAAYADSHSTVREMFIVDAGGRAKLVKKHVSGRELI